MIKPEELKVGQYITILKVDKTREDRSWIGQAFKVSAVDLPFVALWAVNGIYNSPIAIDTRVAELKECSAEYAEAFKP